MLCPLWSWIYANKNANLFKRKNVSNGIITWNAKKVSRWEMRWHQSTLVLWSILFYNILMSSRLIVLKCHLRLWIFDFKTKFITLDKTLIKRLWVIAVHNLVQLKVWYGTMAFFLVFILFNFVTIWFSETENFQSMCKKILFYENF